MLTGFEPNAVQGTHWSKWSGVWRGASLIGLVALVLVGMVSTAHGKSAKATVADDHGRVEAVMGTTSTGSSTEAALAQPKALEKMVQHAAGCITEPLTCAMHAVEAVIGPDAQRESRATPGPSPLVRSRIAANSAIEVPQGAQ